VQWALKKEASGWAAGLENGKALFLVSSE